MATEWLRYYGLKRAPPRPVLISPPSPPCPDDDGAL
jgi:hypothetical protein